jgi:hypothetical protein
MNYYQLMAYDDAEFAKFKAITIHESTSHITVEL